MIMLGARQFMALANQSSTALTTLAALLACLTPCDPCLAGGLAVGPGIQIPTTSNDYFQKGTQPLGAGVPGSFTQILDVSQCAFCHANYGSTDPLTQVEPYRPWIGSMMGQAARDPLFHAGLVIANQDAAGVGEYCIRCHSPNAFLNGHHVPPDASAFTGADWEGVNCNFCHRMLDPEYVAGQSPTQDQQILADLATAGLATPEGTNARYTVDPTDSRRGPFSDIPQNIHPGRPQPEIIPSAFHRSAELCWTCHDVSNPLMSKEPNGSYALNSLDAQHPSGIQIEMLPIHRTYSEWKNSYYSSVGVQHNGRFGGNHVFNPDFIANNTNGVMKTCQDCHMPDQAGYGCNFEFPPFFSRHDAPQHSFLGSNTWVINAVRQVDFDEDSIPDFPDAVTGLNDDIVAEAIARNTNMLELASDMELSLVSGGVKVRLINKTGHKLPTGFPDGRRAWINVQFLDCNDEIINELGAYDFDTGTLNREGTKVYEMVLGIDGADYSQSIGRPEGPTQHFILANKILKDNRIPPAGHSTIIAQQMQTQSIGATFAHGQNWDDTIFAIPSGTRKVTVMAYYQVTSKEFIEHLRDDNITDTKGLEVYDLWVANGRGAPVVLDFAEIDVFRAEDLNHDSLVNVEDLLVVIGAWGSCPGLPQLCPADVNHDKVVNVSDLLAIIAAWGDC